MCYTAPPKGAIILITDTLIPVFNFLNKYRIFIFMYCFYWVIYFIVNIYLLHKFYNFNKKGENLTISKVFPDLLFNWIIPVKWYQINQFSQSEADMKYVNKIYLIHLCIYSIFSILSFNFIIIL